MAKRPVNDMLEVTEAARQAESALLGSILIEAACAEITPECLFPIRRLVQPADFMDFDVQGCHSRIYAAMIKCEHPDQVSVAQELQRQGQLRNLDCAYMSQLIAETPTSLDWRYYAKVVQENGRKRRAQYLAMNGDMEGTRRVLGAKRFEGGLPLEGDL